MGRLSARVRSSLSAWKAIGAPLTVRRWIRDGYRFPIVKRVLPFHRARPPQPCHARPLAEMIQQLRDQGTVLETSQVDFVSHSRLEPKKDGTFRLIVDLRHINSHLKEASCRYETAGALANLLEKEDWMFSLDLKSGYYHVPIHPTSRRFATIQEGGKTYQFTELMFGLKPACLVFTKFMRPVVAHLRSRGLRVHPYLDDFLIAHESKEVLMRERDYVEQLFESLGLTRNKAKGHWDLTQRLEHLGYTVDTVQGFFGVPPKKLETIQALAASLLAYQETHRGWVSKDRLAALAGRLMSLRLAIPYVRTLVHEMYLSMSSIEGWNCDVQLTSPQVIADLRRISTLRLEDCHLPWQIPPHTMSATTDASSTGWGFTLGNLEIHGVFQPAHAGQIIAIKEFLAVLYGLQRFATALTGNVLRLFVDNTVVLNVIRKGASTSPEIMAIWRRVLAICREFSILLVPEYIQSKMNTRADALSRLIPHSEWSLSPSRFRWIERRFGLRTVDRFATVGNKKCRQFNCLTYHPLSLGDAFACPWAGERNYVCPPFALVQRVLTKLRREGAEAVVVVPYFPAATWWPLIVRLACCVTILSARQTEAAVVCTLAGVTPEPRRNRRWRLAIAYLPGDSLMVPSWPHYCGTRPGPQRESVMSRSGAAMRELVSAPRDCPLSPCLSSRSDDT